MPFIYSKINIAVLLWLHNVNIHNISTGFDDVTCLSNRSISATFATWHHCNSKQRPLLCDQSGPWDLRCQQRILVSICLRQIDIHSLLSLDYVIINTWYIGFDRESINVLKNFRLAGRVQWTCIMICHLEASWSWWRGAVGRQLGIIVSMCLR